MLQNQRRSPDGKGQILSVPQIHFWHLWPEEWAEVSVQATGVFLAFSPEGMKDASGTGSDIISSWAWPDGRKIRDGIAGKRDEEKFWKRNGREIC